MFFHRPRSFTSIGASSENDKENFVIMKLKSPEFYSIFKPELKKLDSIFTKHGYELRIVGGAVRSEQIFFVSICCYYHICSVLNVVLSFPQRSTYRKKTK